MCRFDIDGDKETQVNSPFHDYTDIPNNLVPYPPPQDGPQIQNRQYHLIVTIAVMCKKSY